MRALDPWRCDNAARKRIGQHADLATFEHSDNAALCNAQPLRTRAGYHDVLPELWWAIGAEPKDLRARAECHSETIVTTRFDTYNAGSNCDRRHVTNVRRQNCESNCRKVACKAMADPEAATKVISYVGEFILGGIAVFAIAIAYWAIRELKKAHESHVRSLEKGSAQHVEMHAAYQASNAEVVAAIGRLTDTENTQTAAIQSNTIASSEVKAEVRNSREEMTNLRRSVDDIIREAVRRRRHSSDRNPIVRND